MARLWAISDIHTDCKENRAWVEQLSNTEFKQDAILVAGDVSDSRAILERTLRTLVAKFQTVFFTPGNHDLWLGEEDEADSISKLHSLLGLCRSLGVQTKPQRIGTETIGVWVCPLLSWHHKTFDKEPDIEGWSIPSIEDSMVDYHKCRFPEPLSMHDESAARAVDDLNEAATAALQDRRLEEPLVTFSHFLPRPELLIEKRFLTLPTLPKAVGSRYLGQRVKSLAPDVHVFGHTHFGWDATHDGIRYIQCALAYPYERLQRWGSLSIGGFGAEGPLLVWSASRGFAPKMHCRWSRYYERHKRQPDKVFELAYYAAPHYKKMDSRAVECRPDFSHEGPEMQVPISRPLQRDPVDPVS
eukprot:TRINITY_DN36863_c0_g1_i1.p1 TRINITY_DN36863_c0_g1~~TRINITY_DN36863_c0_g1_i1.p1  ORF type:complete len:374 (+),score=49.29 TRINITY_DN36863_c0_g1_i1:54-1124(+)